MTRGARWGVVVALAAVLVATPLALRAWPVPDSSISAAALLRAVQGSADRSWSGYAETEGALQLPDADRFSDVAELFGEDNRVRAWWRDSDHWRVDRLLTAGEQDLVHDGDRTTAYDYERAEATVSTDPAIRLPRSADVLPPTLARRLLAGVGAAQAERLPTRRVAGRAAAGLRVRPAGDSSRIGRVDLWADLGTGVPLRVEVYAAGSDGPAFTAAFADWTPERPTSTEVAYTATASTDVRFDDVLDIADAANQYAPIRPPASVAGLAATAASDGAVGVYGQGLTQVIAIPLRDREADALRDQLAVTPGAEKVDVGTVVGLGPLGVALTGGPGDGGWLLAGTLTADALEQAAGDLLRGSRFVGSRG